MKKIVTLMLVLFAAFAGLQAQSANGGWNYVYHVTRETCLNTDDNRLPPGMFIQRGCTIKKYERANTVMVVDCTDDPHIHGLVFFARTLVACEYVKNRYFSE